MKLISTLFLILIFSSVQASLWPDKILSPDSMLKLFLKPFEAHMEQVLNRHIITDDFEVMEFRRFFTDENRYIFYFKTLPIADGLAGVLETHKHGEGDRFIINLKHQTVPDAKKLRDDLLNFRWYQYFEKGNAAFSWDVKKLLIKKTVDGNRYHFLLRIGEQVLSISEFESEDIRRQLIDLICNECDSPHSTISVELNKKLNLSPEYYVKIYNGPNGDKRQLSPFEFFNIYQAIMGLIQNQFLIWKEQVAWSGAWPK